MNQESSLATPKTANGLASASGGLLDDVRSLAAHAESLIRATAALSSEGVAVAREKLSTSLRGLQQQLADVETVALTRARSALAASDEYVRQRPWQSIGAALLAGVVIGVLLTPRRKS